MESELERRRGIKPLPIDLSFIQPVKAFYATSPSWNENRYSPPFEITDDTHFVLGRVPYRLVPFNNFLDSFRHLVSASALEIKPSDLKESIDRDRLSDSIEDGRYRYFLCNNVLMRARPDYTPDGENMIHSLIFLGLPANIEKLTAEMGLPHPFDASKYYYRNFFHDSRSPPLPILLRKSPAN